MIPSGRILKSPGPSYYINLNTTRTNETIKEYFTMTKAKRDQIKDIGGFVGGPLKSGRRKAENLAYRSY